MNRVKSTLMTILWAATVTVAAQSIKPGQTWNDTGGAAINAHGGCVVYADGYYYWFGEQRNGNKSDGISCYRSSNLYSWTKLSRAVTPTGSMTDENRDIASEIPMCSPMSSGPTAAIRATKPSSSTPTGRPTTSILPR